jgi:SpoVK/Ycf46/Vps4 family AAA+-type ATPase
MTHWDGLTTQKHNRILIIGATNRPEDVDAAILRRMPKMFHIGLPNAIQRLKILKVILKDENLAEDVDLKEIAEKTQEFSGSDLHELCRNAAMNSFIETVKILNESIKSNESSNDEVSDETKEHHDSFIRRIDFDIAFEKMSTKNFVNKNRFDFLNFKH